MEADYDVKIERLIICNALGQEVFTLLNPEIKEEIDISNLPTGFIF